MATTLTIDMIAQMSGDYKNTGDLADALETISINTKKSYTNGTGDNKSDRIVGISATATAAAVTYDLDAGTLTDSFGNAVTFTKIRSLYLRNKSTTSGEVLTISGDWFITKVLSGTTPTFKLNPDSFILLTSAIDGYAVTATTADQLTVDPGANTISYDLVLIGED